MSFLRRCDLKMQIQYAFVFGNVGAQPQRWGMTAENLWHHSWLWWTVLSGTLGRVVGSSPALIVRSSSLFFHHPFFIKVGALLYCTICFQASCQVWEVFNLPLKWISPSEMNFAVDSFERHADITFCLWLWYSFTFLFLPFHCWRKCLNTSVFTGNGPLSEWQRYFFCIELYCVAAGRRIHFCTIACNIIETEEDQISPWHVVFTRAWNIDWAFKVTKLYVVYTMINTPFFNTNILLMYLLLNKAAQRGGWMDGWILCSKQ